MNGWGGGRGKTGKGRPSKKGALPKTASRVRSSSKAKSPTKGGQGGGVKAKPLPVEARLSMSLGALVAR